MAFDITKDMTPFMISLIYDAITDVIPENRKASTVYAIGDQVSNGKIVYAAIVGGTTGTGTGPSNTTGTSMDGSVQQLAIGQRNHLPGDIDSNFYLAVGKNNTSEQSNPSLPDKPNTSLNGRKDVLDTSIAFLRIEPSEIKKGIRNNTQTTGIVYTQFDPTITDYTQPHYCITAEKNVYLCVDNNNGAESTESPEGTGSSLIETADGYIQKFAGEIDSNEFSTFGSNQVTPSPQDTNQTQVDGQIATFSGVVATPTPFDSEDIIQVQVVGDGTGCSAAARTIGGSLYGIYATDGGSGYSKGVAIASKQGEPGSGATAEATVNGGEVTGIDVITTGTGYASASVVVIGDGIGAKATAVTTGGQVTSVSIVSGGEGYTKATVYIIPGSKGGVATAFVSPFGGIGYDKATQLGEKYLIVSKTLASSLDDYIPTSGDSTFRQVALVSNISMSSDGASACIGPQHPDFNSSEATQPKYSNGTGTVLYISNFSAITHSDTQEEVIKIAISL